MRLTIACCQVLLNKEELEAYDYAVMREQDERGKLVHAEKKGKIDEAREMQKEGFDYATISRLTGLSEEEIQNL